VTLRQGQARAIGGAANATHPPHRATPPPAAGHLAPPSRSPRRSPGQTTRRNRGTNRDSTAISFLLRRQPSGGRDRRGIPSPPLVPPHRIYGDHLPQPRIAPHRRHGEQVVSPGPTPTSTRPGWWIQWQIPATDPVRLRGQSAALEGFAQRLFSSISITLPELSCQPGFPTSPLTLAARLQIYAACHPLGMAMALGRWPAQLESDDGAGNPPLKLAARGIALSAGCHSRAGGPMPNATAILRPMHGRLPALQPRAD